MKGVERVSGEDTHPQIFQICMYIAAIVHTHTHTHNHNCDDIVAVGVVAVVAAAAAAAAAFSCIFNSISIQKITKNVL